MHTLGIHSASEPGSQPYRSVHWERLATLLAKSNNGTRRAVNETDHDWKVFADSLSAQQLISMYGREELEWMRKLLIGFLRSYLMTHRRITNGKWHGVSGLRRSKWNYHFAVCASWRARVFRGRDFRCQYTGVPMEMKMQSITLKSIRKQIPGSTDRFAARILFYFPMDSPTLLIAKYIFRPVWFDLENSADRHRNFECWWLNYESKYVVRMMVWRRWITCPK